MANDIHILEKPKADDPPKQQRKTNPSGATDRTKEREKKFDEEGGDQPQALSQAAVDRELQKIREEDRE